MVEFAFVAVILVTMLIGIGAFGYALYAYHGISNLAREATRWAAVNGSTCNSDRDTTASTPDVGSCTAPVTYDVTTHTGSLCTATTGTACTDAGPSTSSPTVCTVSDTASDQCYIGNYVLMRAGGLNPNDITTTVSYPQNIDNASVCTTTYNAPGCTVKVQVQYTFTFPLIFVTKPITLTSTSEMIIVH